MRDSKKMYEEVAVRCSSYCPKESCCKNSTKNSTKTNVSCATCKHFTKDEHCDIDLYDAIVENHKLKQ